MSWAQVSEDDREREGDKPPTTLGTYDSTCFVKPEMEPGVSSGKMSEKDDLSDETDGELLVRLSKWYLRQNEAGELEENTNLLHTEETYVAAETLGISLEYNMSHRRRGKFLIINNRHFDSRTKMTPRLSSDKDAAQLYQLFKRFGFEVIMKLDQTVLEMQLLLDNISKEDHRDADCFACAILSHGEEGQIFGKDGIIYIDTLLEPFKRPRRNGLAGKPKLFFIQACQGTRLDDGRTVSDGEDEEADSGPTHKIPVESDFLIAHSTCKGYFSWRNKCNGSWFIQTLSKVLDECGERQEIIWILTVVNQLVARTASNTGPSLPEMDQKKQTPCIMSTLRKLLYFRPKSK